jgi:hypothetical protein
MDICLHPLVSMKNWCQSYYFVTDKYFVLMIANVKVEINKKANKQVVSIMNLIRNYFIWNSTLLLMFYWCVSTVNLFINFSDISVLFFLDDVFTNFYFRLDNRYLFAKSPINCGVLIIISIFNFICVKGSFIFLLITKDKLFYGRFFFKMHEFHFSLLLNQKILIISR